MPHTEPNSPRVHHVYELPAESEERIGNLFHQLDSNGDGRIDVADLSAGLKRLNIHISPGAVEHIIKKADVTQSNDLTFAEFVNYVQEHEKQLLLTFHALDANSDGRVDERELVSSFQELGISITADEAQRLVKRMDKDGTLKISFDEWRDYLMFHPSPNLHDIIVYWRHATHMDLGEDLSIPDDFSKEEWVSGKWWKHLVSGGVAGMFSRTFTAPLDRLKVFLQVHGTSGHTSMKKCFEYLLKEGGVRSMWRGNGINVLKIAPESSLKFAAYEQAKIVLLGRRNGQEVSFHERFIAGSFAGAFAQSSIYPLEVLKTRLALRKTGQYRGILDAATKILQKEGVRSFYKGYLPNLIGIIPYAGIDFTIYETLKRKFMANNKSTESPSGFVIAICGAFSSTCGQIASYPLSLVRTRLQAQVITAGSIHTGPTTMTGLFKHIVAHEGVPGLYRGITPNFLKVAPAVSISYIVYEKCGAYLGITMT